jgi:hypothetical protein
MSANFCEPSESLSAGDRPCYARSYGHIGGMDGSSFRIHGCHRHGSRFMSKEKSKYIDVINVNTDIYIEVLIKI